MLIVTTSVNQMLLAPKRDTAADVSTSLAQPSSLSVWYLVHRVGRMGGPLLCFEGRQ